MITEIQTVSSFKDAIDYIAEQSATRLSEAQAAEAVKLLFEFVYEEGFAGRVVQFADVGRFQPLPHNPTALEWIDSVAAPRELTPHLKLII